MVVEINRGPKFLDAALAHTPLVLALEVVFGKLLPVSKLCKKISRAYMCIYDD